MPLSRRKFLAAGGAVLGATAVDAFAIEPQRIDVTRHEVPVPGLPPALDGFRIAHVTDLHLYSGMHRAARETMAIIGQEAPDLTVLIGDLAERSTELKELAPFIRACQGRVGTIATLGNWEYYAGISRELAAPVYERGGAELLVNAARTFTVRGATISVIGLDDPRAGHPDLNRALEDAAPADASIWLVHAPAWVDTVARDLGSHPDCILSGHTHGGQIRLPGVPPLLPPGCGRFLEGWYRDTMSPLYVSRGIGTSGIRARFRCAPELPILTLRRDNRS